MPKKIDDAPMGDETTEAAVDVPMDATTPEPAAEPAAAEPADFDLMEWLTGLGPVVAEYPLPGGGRIPMRSRTEDWRRQWVEDTEGLEDAERDRIFVAAHVADERVTPAVLAALQEHRPTDWADIVMLAINLDTRPTNLLAPRFLPGASD